jgi:putative transposase
VSRCAYRYQGKRTADEPIAQELQDLAHRQPRWGCGKMTDYLRNQGYGWNHKRIRRVSCLAAHKRKPKKHYPPLRPLVVPGPTNLVVDFMMMPVQWQAFRP